MPNEADLIAIIWNAMNQRTGQAASDSATARYAAWDILRRINAPKAS